MRERERRVGDESKKIERDVLFKINRKKETKNKKRKNELQGQKRKDVQREDKGITKTEKIQRDI